MPFLNIFYWTGSRRRQNQEITWLCTRPEHCLVEKKIHFKKSCYASSSTAPHPCTASGLECWGQTRYTENLDNKPLISTHYRIEYNGQRLKQKKLAEILGQNFAHQCTGCGALHSSWEIMKSSSWRVWLFIDPGLFICGPAISTNLCLCGKSCRSVTVDTGLSSAGCWSCLQPLGILRRNELLSGLTHALLYCCILKICTLSKRASGNLVLTEF